jgi:Na+/H+ antiporter NhaD/arsenite permease-like protein
MTALIVTVFLLVYLGMLFGGLPFVQLDRTGIALLGAISLVASKAMSVEEAFRSLFIATWFSVHF